MFIFISKTHFLNYLVNLCWGRYGNQHLVNICEVPTSVLGSLYTCFQRILISIMQNGYGYAHFTMEVIELNLPRLINSRLADTKSSINTDIADLKATVLGSTIIL